MSRILAVAALLVAAACASTTNPHYSVVRLKDYSEKDGLVSGVLDLTDPNVVLLCGMETPTGTHVAKRICRSEAQLALIHQHTQDWLHQVRSGVNTGNAVSSNGRAFVAP